MILTSESIPQILPAGKFLHGRNKPVQEFVINNIGLDRKIKEACTDLKPSAQWALNELPRNEDKELIADFILNYSNESDSAMPMTVNTKKLYVAALVYLARHHDRKKSFKEVTPEDFFSKEIIDEKAGKKRGYLESLKRTIEDDVQQKWVNTYNNRLTKYIVFYKWLTQPDLKREERQVPPQLKGFRYAKRKSKTSTKREHMWTDEEHRVFLKYCEDLRLACFHAMAKDTGARPSELLALRINDLQIQTSPSTGKRYAEFTIGDKLGGKMKKPRPATISDAIPYYNVWVAVHPMRDSPQGAYLFPSRENQSKYRNIPLKHDSLRLVYVRTIREQFPKILDRPDVPVKDKVALRGLIFDKNKHRPYLRRHEFSSEIGPKCRSLCLTNCWDTQRLAECLKFTLMS